VVVTDVEMTRSAITGTPAVSYLGEAGADPDQSLTRSAAAMRLAAARHPKGAVFAVGCAPTALAELIRLASDGVVVPALVVGLPVGFVGAAEAKEALLRSGLPAVANRGEKGGSAAAGAAVNAMVRLARGD
jgi:precorrin-8X/cobalt-precorrin-8 methylmutase